MICKAGFDLYDEIFLPTAQQADPQLSSPRHSPQVSQLEVQNDDTGTIRKLRRKNEKLTVEIAGQKELNKVVARNFYSLLLTARKEIAAKNDQIHKLTLEVAEQKTMAKKACDCSIKADLSKSRQCTRRSDILELTFKEAGGAHKWLEKLWPRATTSNPNHAESERHSSAKENSPHCHRSATTRLKPVNRSPERRTHRSNPGSRSKSGREDDRRRERSSRSHARCNNAKTDVVKAARRSYTHLSRKK